MIEKKIPFKTMHRDLPAYAGKCDIYFAKGPGGKASQAKLYDSDKKMSLDFDWDHDHVNKSDGKRFPKGTIHVQEYRIERIKNPKTGKEAIELTRMKKLRSPLQ